MAQKSLYQAPKGAVDLVGQAARAWEYLQRLAAQIFPNYGYEPIYTPIFEAAEVFSRGIGTATDVVNKEMYTFTDRAQRDLALRPENTAGVVRAVIQNNLLADTGLSRLYYAGPMFRYERPQKGRQRQFYQIGVEALGSARPELDAEMISLLWEYLRAALSGQGEGGRAALAEDRMVLLVNSMGCPQCRPAYRERLADYLRAHGDDLCSECQERARTNPLRAFDCKNPQCQSVMASAPKLSEALCEDCAGHQDRVLDLLDRLGLRYTLDPTLVRGLDYYTRTVFEIQLKEGLGAQNALGGGGRYDGLFEQLGGKPTPGIGFALGFERTLLALEALDVATGARASRPVYVAATQDDLRDDAFLLTQEIRAGAGAALCDLQYRSLKAQLRAADRSGARLVVIVGPQEAAAGKVRLRDMQTGTEVLIDRTGAPRAIIERQKTTIRE